MAEACCEWCGETFDEAALNGAGLCADCSSPGVQEAQFERAYDAYQRTYYEQSSCPRCGRVPEQWFELAARGQVRTVTVCEECYDDAMASDATFWDWYWRR